MTSATYESNNTSNNNNNNSNNNTNSDGSTLNSLPIIIIKKKDIGLEPYQHQPYQYILFNNMVKRSGTLEDVNKVRERLEKSVPNMQQVIHADMERIKTNKVYERKLKHDLTGPRGLNWQCRQEMQRLRQDERDVARDLVRLNRDLAKYGSISSNNLLSPRQPSKDSSQNAALRLSIIREESAASTPLLKLRPLPGRSISMNSSQSPVPRFLPPQQQRNPPNRNRIPNRNLDWLHQYTLRQAVAKTNDDRPYLRQHADAINQQKRELERKLKQFLH